MTSILAIDTATDICSVALNRSDVILLRKSPEARKHAAEVLPMVQSLLDESGIKLAQLDAIVMVSGPGSFTGLRIGTAVAQGLSFGVDIPVIRISSMMILARAAFLASGQCAGTVSVFAVCVHAREDEFYFASYLDDGSSQPKALIDDHISDAASILAQLRASAERSGADSESCCLAGDGWLHPLLRQSVDSPDVCRQITELSGDASILHQLGQYAYVSGQLESADQALPVYLKDDMAYRKP